MGANPVASTKMGLRSNKTGWLCNLDLGPYSKQRHAIYGETLDRIKQLL